MEAIFMAFLFIMGHTPQGERAEGCEGVVRIKIVL